MRTPAETAVKLIGFDQAVGESGGGDSVSQEESNFREPSGLPEVRVRAYHRHPQEEEEPHVPPLNRAKKPGEREVPSPTKASAEISIVLTDKIPLGRIFWAEV